MDAQRRGLAVGRPSHLEPPPGGPSPAQRQEAMGPHLTQGGHSGGAPTGTATTGGLGAPPPLRCPPAVVFASLGEDPRMGPGSQEKT